MNPRVIVVGDLTLDDVVLPDGSTHMASIGGDSLYAALGARLWEPRVGVVTRRGEDFPRDRLGSLEALGICLDGVVDIPGPTVRNWVIYEEDGRRRWVYRTAPGRPGEVAVRPEDIPAHWLRSNPAPVVHVAAMPIDAAEHIIDAVRATAPDAIITLDTHEDYVSRYREQLLRLAARVNVFLPSREELADLVGYDDPRRALDELSKKATLPTVVVKMGKEGILVWHKTDGVHSVPAVPAAIVDETGAGDSFCGGLAAGLALGLDPLEAARRGAVSAAFAVERLGSLALAGVTPDEATARLTGSRGPSTRDRYAIELMLDEIHSAPQVIAAQLASPDPSIGKLARSLCESGINHLYMTGCGDSYLAGAAAALAFDRHSGIAAEAIHALDLARYRVRYLPKASAVLCVSSSGEVGRTIEAAAQARAFGHRVIALTGSDRSRLAAEATDMIPLTYPAIGATPGTISFLAMLMTLYELALQWGAARGVQVDAARTALERAPKLATDTLARCEESSARLADRWRNRATITFIGAGPSDATARFGAAKLLEGPQMRGVSTNLEEWAHGEYFVTEPGQPVVVVGPSGAASDRVGEILSELAFIGADSALISDEPRGRDTANCIQLATGLPEEFSPLLAALPLSLLAFYLARARGKRSYNFPSPEAAQGTLRHHSPRPPRRAGVREVGLQVAPDNVPLADVEAEAVRLLQRAGEANLTVRLLGGTAVSLHRHRPLPPALERTYGDIDVVVKRGHDGGLKKTLEGLGYVANRRFNGLHGDRRLLFYDEHNGRQVDVFIGNFRMCHTLTLDDRLTLHPHTLAPADLLLTKLQIVKINAKDVVDAWALLYEHEVAAAPAGDVIDLNRLAQVTGRDWGWFTTFTDNLARLVPGPDQAMPPEVASEIASRVTTIQQALTGASKSFSWKARATVGRRMSWYEDPEEIGGG